MKRVLLFLALVLLLCGCRGGGFSLEGTQLAFETTDIDGNPVSSADLFSAHEITMLNLWGTWCGPCVQELPQLSRVDAVMAEMDGAVVGLLNDGNGTNDVELAKRYLAENNVSYLNILAPENMNEIIRQNYYPMTVFVDREGVIIGDTVLGAPPKKFAVDYYTEAAKKALESRDKTNH